MSNIITATVKRLPLLYKVLIMLVTAVAIVAIFPHTRHGVHYDYKVGAVWREADLVAPYDFAVLKSADEIRGEEESERHKAILYYREDSTARATAIQRLESGKWKMDSGERRRLKRQMDSIYRSGYIALPDGVSTLDGREVVLLQGNVGSMHKGSDFVTFADLDAGLLRDSLLVPNLVPDEARTALELDSRLSQISYSSQMVMAGDHIVSKGEEVSEEKAQIIRSLEAENDRRFSDSFSLAGQMAGQLLLAIIAFTALYMFLKNTRHPILEDNRKVTFVMLTILLMSAVEALVTRVNPDWVLLVPLCIVPILMRVFFDMRVALYIHLTTVIILANLVPNAFEFIFYQLITGMMSIIAVRDLERRSQFFVLALVIFISYSFIYTAGVLSQDTNLHALTLDRYLMFFLNALMTLMAYPLIYVFEKFFGITTSLTLMELSSTSHPALRELSQKAPGTFQHSVQVANIAEDLVGEIGGDSLLTKVGALYHDIGKVRNPFRERPDNHRPRHRRPRAGTQIPPAVGGAGLHTHPPRHHEHRLLLRQGIGAPPRRRLRQEPVPLPGTAPLQPRDRRGDDSGHRRGRLPQPEGALQGGHRRDDRPPDRRQGAGRTTRQLPPHLRGHSKHPQVPQGEDDEHLSCESGIPDGEKLRVKNQEFKN